MERRSERSCCETLDKVSAIQQNMPSVLNLKQPLYHIAALMAATVACGGGPPSFVERHEYLIFETLPPVHVRLLVAPELVDRSDRYMAAARAALGRFGEWYGPYPHDELTLVDPGWRDVAPMPGAVVLRTRWLSFERSAAVESLVIDAVARRFWQLRRPSTNRDHTEFINGLSAFSSARAVAELLPDTEFQEHRYFGGFVPYVVRSFPNASGEKPSATRFALTSGNRSALAFATLERYIGWGPLQAALWEFAQLRRINHAEPPEFFKILRDSTSHDLDWFVDEVVATSKVFDYGIAWFDSKPSAAGARYETVVVIRRFGDGVFSGGTRPREGSYQSGRGIELRVSFESGDEIQEHWDGRDDEARYEYESTSPAVAATVDPEGILKLDTNRANNHRSLRSAGIETAAMSAVGRSIWLQNLLLTYGFFF